MNTCKLRIFKFFTVYSFYYLQFLLTKANLSGLKILGSEVSLLPLHQVFINSTYILSNYTSFRLHYKISLLTKSPIRSAFVVWGWGCKSCKVRIKNQRRLGLKDNKKTGNILIECCIIKGSYTCQKLSA